MDIKYNTDTKIEDNARLYQLQKAHFDQEVNTAVSLFLAKYAIDWSIFPTKSLTKCSFYFILILQKAEAQLAYELQAAKIKQRIRNEEIQIEVVERRKQIEVEEQEIRRKEHELQSTVRLPAEAEFYKMGRIAEGKR